MNKFFELIGKVTALVLLVAMVCYGVWFVKVSTTVETTYVNGYKIVEEYRIRNFAEVTYDATMTNLATGEKYQYTEDEFLNNVGFYMNLLMEENYPMGA